MSNSDIMVRFGADIEPLKKGAQKAAKSLGDIREKANVGAKAFTAMAAAAAAAGVVMVKAGMESVDAQAKLAAQLKTTSADLAILSRAFDMSGVSQEQLRSGTRALTNRLSQAAAGAGAAKDILERLNVTIDELSRMPLSERMATLNQAIKDNIPVTEQAAASAALFGEEAGLAFSQVSAETIGTATEQVNKLGLAISGVDAAKIEAANDALSRGAMASKAMTQQLAVQFAPVLQGLSDLLYDNADGADMMRNAVQKAYDIIIQGAGFAGNALRGIEVIVKGLLVGFHGFSVGVNTVLAAIPKSVDYVINSAKNAINSLISSMNKLPGVNIEPLVMSVSSATQYMTGLVDTAKANMQSAQDALHESLMKPLPSDALSDWVAQVEHTAQVAAEAANKVREDGLKIPELPPVEGDPRIQHESEVLGRMFEMHKAMNDAATENTRKAKEEQAAAQKWYASESISAFSGMFGNLSSIMDKENKKQFEASKKLASVQAVLDTIAAAQAAYKSLAGIPVVGPGLGAAAAGAAVLAGMKRVQQINSQSYGGSSSVPSSSGGATSAGSAPAASGQVEGGSQTMFVEGLNSDQLFSGTMVRGLVEKINEFSQDGGKVILA